MKGGGTTADGGNLDQDAKEEEGKKKAKKKRHHHKHERESAAADSSHKHTHHHHHKDEKHHKSIPKPTGIAPTPANFATRIVQEMHPDDKPIPLAQNPIEKIDGLTADAPVNTPAKASATIAPVKALSFFAKAGKWLKEKLQPIFSRQAKITNAYSYNFLRTLKAIEKRLSANDAEHPEESATLGKKPPLRFKGAVVEKSNRPTATVVDLSANTKPIKPPTLH